ncbi:sensor histidine kinase [Amycolatopsis sp.]|uniref:sensor histidine kinase n=1 Tax=Amycolatopsis sp. TaxID=37632 RepID=UPI002D7F6C4F|nr:histidine kinase [Amycolatopsis sp.]HET6704698.1 histidine kinase [Amycolatopsis sp.]
MRSSRWWHVAAPMVAAVLVGVFQLSYRSSEGWVHPSIWQLAVYLAECLALLVRYRHPVAVAAVTVAFSAALPMIRPHAVIIDVPAIVALYTVARHTGRRTAWTAAAAAAVLLTVSSAWWRSEHLLDLRNLLPANYVAIAVAVGDSVRANRALLRQAQERAREAERTREDEARRRVHDERVRIARDLHDVVAHHITLVNAQAGVAHHLLDRQPDQARQALAGIKDTSRAALDELRATVGLLRQDDDPPESRRPVPGFAELGAVVESFRSAGFDVRLTTRGDVRPLAGAADLAAYRIVQEALTNAGKHGTERRAHVVLTYADDVLELTVTNPARPGHRGPGTGHGLIGMRERATTAGGSCTAGPRADGHYELRATLPLREPAS